MRNNYKSLKRRKHNRIDGDELRFFPENIFSYNLTSNSDFWDIPLGWLINLRLTPSDFIWSNTNECFLAKLTLPNGSGCTLEMISKDYKRSFGLTSSLYMFGEGRCCLFLDDDKDNVNFFLPNSIR